MIIKVVIDHRTKYYKHTSAGRPILGARGEAAHFTMELAKKVLDQLRTIDHRFADAELVE